MSGDDPREDVRTVREVLEWARAEVQMLGEGYSRLLRQYEPPYASYVPIVSDARVDRALAALDRLEHHLRECRWTLRVIADWIEERYREGDRDYQVAIVARDTLSRHLGERT